MVPRNTSFLILLIIHIWLLTGTFELLPQLQNITAIGGIIQTYPPNTYFGESLLTRYAHATPKGELVCIYIYIISADDMSVANISVCDIFVDDLYVDYLYVDDLSIDDLSVDDICVHNLSVDGLLLPVDDLSVDYLSVDDISVDNISVIRVKCWERLNTTMDTKSFPVRRECFVVSCTGSSLPSIRR